MVYSGREKKREKKITATTQQQQQQWQRKELYDKIQDSDKEK